MSVNSVQKITSLNSNLLSSQLEDIKMYLKTQSEETKTEFLNYYKIYPDYSSTTERFESFLKMKVTK